MFKRSVLSSRMLWCPLLVFFKEIDGWRFENPAFFHRLFQARVGQKRASVFQIVPSEKYDEIVGIVIGMENLQ